MVITLTKEYKSAYGINYKAGDKIDCDNDTYQKILAEGSCEAIKKAPSKKKKVAVKPETKKEDNGAN